MRRYFFDLHLAHRTLLGHANRHLLDTFDVTAAQLAVLHLIGERDACTAADIVKELRSGKSAVSGILRRLESAGLVAREPDRHDKRRVLLSLTAGGIALQRASSPEIQGLQAAWLADISPADLEAFGRVLDHTIAMYRDERDDDV